MPATQLLPDLTGKISYDVVYYLSYWLQMQGLVKNSMEGAYITPWVNDYSLELYIKNHEKSQSTEHKARDNYRWQIVWRNVIAFIYMHIAAVYGFCLVFTAAKIQTIIFTVIYGSIGGIGITAGAHRLWAHRAYKAKWPFRLFLAALQSIAFQNHIYEWVRDHRVHHKFSETDADPHNAKRGFFFSHMGWLMVRKHKDVIEKGATVDMSDLEKDPIVMFQKKFRFLLLPLMSFIIPVWIPIRFWNEDLYVSWYVAGMVRYVVSLHCTWLVNSAAHLYGNKPYNKHIGPTENVWVSLVAEGEGWHNYHHVFPWDYKAAELGNYRANITTALIDLAAKCGLAYDLKTVSNDMIERRVTRTGDGSHPSRRAQTTKIFTKTQFGDGMTST